MRQATNAPTITKTIPIAMRRNETAINEASDLIAYEGTPIVFAIHCYNIDICPLEEVVRDETKAGWTA